MSEIAKCWTKREPKARKRHRCCECGGFIEAGEKYHVFAGIWDDPATFKTCADCEALRQAVSEGRPWDETPVFGGLFEDIEASRDRESVIRMYEICNKRRPAVPLWIREVYLLAVDEFEGAGK